MYNIEGAKPDRHVLSDIIIKDHNASKANN